MTALQARLSILLLAPAILAGCAAPDMLTRETIDPVGQRRDGAVAAFENRRDEAQVEAALARWQQGDARGAAASLRRLLQRHEDNRQALRLLADIELEQQELPAAEARLRRLVELDGDDAQSHHSLGLLLEETGRLDEALHHLDRAVALDPDNLLYRECRQAAAASQPY